MHCEHAYIKCNNGADKINKKRKHLASIMQRIESEVMNSVLFFLINKGCKVLSVYDGIMIFDETNVDEVEELIISRFNKLGYLVKC